MPAADVDEQRPMPVGALRFLFLEICRVKEQDLGQGSRRRGAVHRSAKPRAHEQRQVTRVVDVGMTEHDGIDAIGIDVLRPLQTAHEESCRREQH